MPAPVDRKRLESLLSEPHAEARDRGSRHGDELREGRPLVMHGAGMLGRRLAGLLREQGETVAAFCDNDPGLWGSDVDGLPVLAPGEAASRFGGGHAFVLTVWSPGSDHLELRDQLRSLGANRVIPIQSFFWRHPDHLLPHFLYAPPEYFVEHAEEILEAFDLMGDEGSRAHYAGQIAWRCTLDFELLVPPAPGAQYFPPDLVRLSDEERFVDGGAFTGDTLGVFLELTGGRYAGFEAFEPDPSTFEALRAYVDTLPEADRARVNARNEAVSDCAGCLRFHAGDGTSSKASTSGTTEVRCVRLDDVLDDITYLKLDIEGHEREALSGAQRLISSRHPTLAVCLYHLPQDVFELPLFVRRLDEGYTLACRAHESDGREFVLYALPPAD